MILVSVGAHQLRLATFESFDEWEFCWFIYFTLDLDMSIHVKCNFVHYLREFLYIASQFSFFFHTLTIWRPLAIDCKLFFEECQFECLFFTHWDVRILVGKFCVLLVCISWWSSSSCQFLWNGHGSWYGFSKVSLFLPLSPFLTALVFSTYNEKRNFVVYGRLSNSTVKCNTSMLQLYYT